MKRISSVFAPAPRGAEQANPALAKEQRAAVYGEPGTLYAKCGGIFGVAGFCDRCMDSWMADPTLNANALVANWHGRAQRCGVKLT